MSRNQAKSTSSHGFISVIGRRRSMEDAIAIMPALVHQQSVGGFLHAQHKWSSHPRIGDHQDLPETTSCDFFAVYDGHGAGRMAQRCKERLHHHVVEESLLDGMVDWKSMMVKSFARMDDELKEENGVMIRVVAGAEAMKGRLSALVVLVGEEEIVVANYGDSRVVLCSDGAALALSCDRKVRADVRQRAEASEANETGYENLEPYMISTPDVTVHKRSTSDNFLVIASDGLWDVVSNEMACDIVRTCCSGGVASRLVLESVAGDCASVSATMLVELALARGSKDNISVIVVELQQPSDLVLV